MSKERELLKKCLDFMLDAGANLNPLFKEVNDVLLNQPEQEPVNFDLDRMKLAVESPVSDITGEELMKQIKTNRVFYQEGYAQAELDLKREPLTPQQISVGNQSMLNVTRDAFVNGVKWAEKAHGIGGGE
jgi:hypothetical protein